MKKYKNIIILSISVLLAVLLGIYGCKTYKSSVAKKAVLEETKTISKQLKNQNFDLKSELISEVVAERMKGYLGKEMTNNILLAMGLSEDKLSEAEKKEYELFFSNLNKRLVSKYSVKEESFSVDRNVATITVSFIGLGSWMDMDISGVVSDAQSALSGYISSNNDALMDSADQNGYDILRSHLAEYQNIEIFKGLNAKINNMKSRKFDIVFTLKKRTHDGESVWIFTNAKVKKNK
ncbi:MAG: hypothetical protein K5851_04815 [Lachnospiraceae bacterium]|nr:hypothetical protein [Lachnospiraceae bacterium]